MDKDSVVSSKHNIAVWDKADRRLWGRFYFVAKVLIVVSVFTYNTWVFTYFLNPSLDGAVAFVSEYVSYSQANSWVFRSLDIVTGVFVIFCLGVLTVFIGKQGKMQCVECVDFQSENVLPLNFDYKTNSDFKDNKGVNARITFNSVEKNCTYRQKRLLSKNSDFACKYSKGTFFENLINGVRIFYSARFECFIGIVVLICGFGFAVFTIIDVIFPMECPISVTSKEMLSSDKCVTWGNFIHEFSSALVGVFIVVMILCVFFFARIIFNVVDLSHIKYWRLICFFGFVHLVSIIYTLFGVAFPEYFLVGYGQRISIFSFSIWGLLTFLAILDDKFEVFS